MQVREAERESRVRLPPAWESAGARQELTPEGTTAAWWIS